MPLCSWRRMRLAISPGSVSMSMGYSRSAKAAGLPQTQEHGTAETWRDDTDVVIQALSNPGRERRDCASHPAIARGASWGQGSVSVCGGAEPRLGQGGDQRVDTRGIHTSVP